MPVRLVRSVLRATLAALGVPLALAAQQPQDTAYARLIKEYTTDPKFLPANVASVPWSATVPSPQKHFGTIVGAPGVMHHADEIYGYFRALAKATPRVKVEKVGTTEEGRDIILVVVADEQSMTQLDRYKQALARLADPRTLSPGEAETVIAGAKPIYYLNGGLHSPEMGSPEMLMELAYRLAVSDDPAIKKIRDNVVVIMNPVSEADGRDKQVDWYLRYTKGRPEFDDGFPRSTPYWGRYAVHDNNRDGIQISQALTKAIFGVYYDWHPLVMHDLHESVPLLYISTGTGPYNETNDPIAISEWQVLANNDINALAAAGLPGVWTWGFFDGWWPGYGMWVATNHNSVGRFYETFGNAGADTYVRDLSDDRYANEPVTARTWYRPSPPTKKVKWSARNNTNFMQAGVLASLTYAADNAKTMLRNFYQKGSNSIARGRTMTPHAYVIPRFDKQHDPKRVAYLVNQLRRHKIEVHEVTAGDSTGDYVVLLNQPYRDLAVNLLSKQNFPASAQYPPYDDIAWTLQYLYGVDVEAVNDTAVFRRPNLRLLADTVTATARVAGTGSVYLLPNRAQGEILPALHWLQSGTRGAPAKGAVKASAIEAQWVAGKDTFPAGSVLFEGMDAATATEVARRFALALTALPAAPPASATRHALDLPRVAIFHMWHDTQDEGWSRYTFEQYGLPYVSIDKDDVRRGKLRSRFDVILIPQARGSAVNLIRGIDKKWGPIPFQKSAATPSMGAPETSPDITGGIEYDGLAELQRFADEGGTLITLGNSTRLVGETGVARELSVSTTRTLFHPGSIVRARARQATSPVLYGYGTHFPIFRGNGPLFGVDDRDTATVVLQYGMKLPEAAKDTGQMLGIAASAPATPAPAAKPAGADSAKGADVAKGAAAEPKLPTDYVLSGMVRGQDEIIGQGAIFDVPIGAGHVVAFTFDPLHRYLNHHEFPLVWNAIMNWNDRVPAAKPATVRAAGSQ
jgi:zinc carboxypeptidase